MKALAYAYACMVVPVFWCRVQNTSNTNPTEITEIILINNLSYVTAMINSKLSKCVVSSKYY